MVVAVDGGGCGGGGGKFSSHYGGMTKLPSKLACKTYKHTIALSLKDKLDSRVYNEWSSLKNCQQTSMCDATFL